MAVQAAAALFRQTTEPSITCSPPPPIAGLRHVRKLQSDREKTTKRWTLTQYSVDHCNPCTSLLRCMSPQLAHRVNSQQRSASVAFGAKRTLTEPRRRKRIY